VSGTELLRQLIARDAADPRIDKLIGDLLGRARNGAALTQQLLTFSRRQPLVPQAVDINECISALSTLLQRALGGRIAVETRLDPLLDRVVIDVNQFEVALLNLAANARDAMDGHGTLSLETCNCPGPIDGVDDEAGTFVRLTVADTGCGMHPDVLSKVFEPFFSTKGNEGTGLGLSQVYGTVRQSGGHIRIDSELGRGTSIHLYLVAFRG
jgi:signal transduction histidine kinase